MKAMILAAGRGERLRPLTDYTPKPLVYVGNKRLIEYLIEALVKAGFDDIVINYAHFGEQFPQVLSNGASYGANIHYSPELSGGLETAGGIINALPLLNTEQFLVVNGDIWTDYDFSQLQQFSFFPDARCHLVLVNNPAHHLQGDFALDQGRVSLLSQPRYTFSGIALYRREMFTGLRNEKRPLKPLLNQAICEQAATGEHYSGHWLDIGTIDRLQQLETLLQHKTP